MPAGLGVGVGVGVSAGDAVKTGVPPVGGDVGTTVNIGVVVGDEWTTGVNVAVDVKTGDGGGVVGAVGLGPDDAVNDIGGVIVGVGGRPAKDGRPLDRKSMIATTASMTRNSVLGPG